MLFCFKALDRRGSTQAHTGCSIKHSSHQVDVLRRFKAKRLAAYSELVRIPTSKAVKVQYTYDFVYETPFVLVSDEQAVRALALCYNGCEFCV